MEVIATIGREAFALDPHAQVPHYMLREASVTCASPPQEVLRIDDALVEVNVQPHWRPRYRISSAATGAVVVEHGDYAAPANAPIAEIDSLAFVEDFFVKFNICHFLFDKLARLAVIAAHGGEVDNVMLFSTNRYTDHFVGRVLGRLPRFVSGPRVRLRVRRLYLVTTSTGRFAHPANFMHPAFTAWLERVREPASSRERVLYVSREDDQVRRALNEAEALAGLPLTVVKPQHLSPAEQVALFAGADVLVGVHGAGLTNLLFMKPGATVIELLPPYCASSSYFIAAERFGHRYVPLVATDAEDGIDRSPPGWSHRKGYNRRDVLLDRDAIAAALELGAAGQRRRTSTHAR